MNEVKINGKIYVPKDTLVRTKAKNKKGLDYCIVRTYSAGVFAGWINRKVKGKEHTIFDSRRIWYWDGAASLSQLAIDGVSKPENCKFAMELPLITLTEAIEIIPCTERAKKNISGVAVWKK